MSLHPLALVGVGGALGSLVRHGVTTASGTSAAVLVLNVVGSLALGSLAAWLQHGADHTREHWRALLGLGFCGGLTTFSAHMVDVAQRLNESAVGEALTLLAATATLAIAAAGLGYEVTRRSLPRTTEGSQ